MVVTLKTKQELAKMRDAGRVVAEVLAIVGERAKAGVSTAELDEVAARESKKRHAVPSFKGYHGFPASTCISVNERVVHGIPSRREVLKPGDVVSLDFGAIYHGWHADSALTVAIGEPTPDVVRLLDGTQDALRAGIEASRIGNRLGDIAHAVETTAHRHGLSVIKGYCGHAIGREMHEGFQVLNHGPSGQGPKLLPGLTFTIEPMLNLGREETDVLPDDWTVVTRDGTYSAHFEHTLAVTEHGPEILTLP